MLVYSDSSIVRRYLQRMLVLEVLLFLFNGLAIWLGATAFVHEWNAGGGSRFGLVVGGILAGSVLLFTAIIVGRVAFLTWNTINIYVQSYELNGTRLIALRDGAEVGTLDLAGPFTVKSWAPVRLPLTYVRDILELSHEGSSVLVAPEHLQNRAGLERAIGKRLSAP